MSPIQYALSEINNVIPKELLKRAFSPPSRFDAFTRGRTPNMIEDRIRSEVIDNRIRNLINLKGSQEIQISLAGLEIITDNNGLGWYCHIPKTLTQGRRIVSVRSIYMGPQILGMGISNMHNFGPVVGRCKDDMYLQMGRELMDNNAPMNLTHTNAVYLIEENTIYCEDRMIHGGLYLRCNVEADEEFGFLTGAYLRPFAELCVLATKAYIYKTLDITMDKGAIESGAEVGKIREWLDKYSDAEEQLQEYIQTTWLKVQGMADKVKRYNYLHMITGGL